MFIGTQIFSQDAAKYQHLAKLKGQKPENSLLSKVFGPKVDLCSKIINKGHKNGKMQQQEVFFQE